MSRARVAVLQVVSHQLSVTSAAAQYGFSRRHLHRLLALGDEHHITVIELDTGEVLSVHQIEPNKTYWRNTQTEPGRWPSSPNRDL